MSISTKEPHHLHRTARCIPQHTGRSSSLPEHRNPFAFKRPRCPPTSTRLTPDSTVRLSSPRETHQTLLTQLWCPTTASFLRSNLFYQQKERILSQMKMWNIQIRDIHPQKKAHLLSKRKIIFKDISIKDYDAFVISNMYLPRKKL